MNNVKAYEMIDKFLKNNLFDDDYNYYSAALDSLCSSVEPVYKGPVYEDMKMAVRWAPSSAYWSEVLVDIFGPDARMGIDAIEKRLRESQAQNRKPLTDKQIEELYFEGFSISKLKDFARAIEAAHGITEESIICKVNVQ